jgi:hypothetical protein
MQKTNNALPADITASLTNARKRIAASLADFEAANAEVLARMAKQERLEQEIVLIEDKIDGDDLKSISTLEAKRAQAALMRRRNEKVDAEGLPSSKKLQALIAAELGRGLMRPLREIAYGEAVATLAPLFADKSRIEALASQADYVRGIDQFTSMFSGDFYQNQPDAGAGRLIATLDRIIAGDQTAFAI